MNATFIDRKWILRSDGLICKTASDLLSSDLFIQVLVRFIEYLKKQNSVLLGIFGEKPTTDETVRELAQIFQLLCKIPINQAKLIFPGSEALKNPENLNEFVEGLYNFWRRFDRFLVCHSETQVGVGLEIRPYRVFNDTAEQLTHLIRSVYRDIQENITRRHCQVYRQVHAGAQVALIAVKKDWPYPNEYTELCSVPMIRQVLLNPPLIIDPPMNKRTGEFRKVDINPISKLSLDPNEWLCYPARVGPLLIHIFFHQSFMELGCSLANLFELAGGDELTKKPDAILVYGASEDDLLQYGPLSTVFFDDEKNGMVVGAIPSGLEFGYFGYLKKMALTLHNVVMMKKQRMPFHGAMVSILLKSGRKATVLIMGDTATGKSETLEALRVVGSGDIRDMTIIADDMGSLKIKRGEVVGYGTEIGAFVRLDDLQQGYAFAQIDRAIIMSPQKVNARAVLPVTTLENILAGHKIDVVLYANNYELVERGDPVIERILSVKEALAIFGRGTAMAKGTTTATGVTHTYFANIFGPPQYRELHDKLAEKCFQTLFKKKVFVGQIRTMLGIPGWETKGPEAGARVLLNLICTLPQK